MDIPNSPNDHFRSFEYMGILDGYEIRSSELAESCYVSWLHMMLYRCTIWEITAIIGRGAGDINDIWTYPIAQMTILGLLNIWVFWMAMNYLSLCLKRLFKRLFRELRSNNHIMMIDVSNNIINYVQAGQSRT